MFPACSKLWRARTGSAIAPNRRPAERSSTQITPPQAKSALTRNICQLTARSLKSRLQACAGRRSQWQRDLTRLASWHLVRLQQTTLPSHNWWLAGDLLQTQPVRHELLAACVKWLGQAPRPSKIFNLKRFNYTGDVSSASGIWTYQWPTWQGSASGTCSFSGFSDSERTGRLQEHAAAFMKKAKQDKTHSRHA